MGCQRSSWECDECYGSFLQKKMHMRECRTVAEDGSHEPEPIQGACTKMNFLNFTSRSSWWFWRLSFLQVACFCRQTFTNLWHGNSVEHPFWFVLVKSSRGVYRAVTVSVSSGTNLPKAPPLFQLVFFPGHEECQNGPISGCRGREVFVHWSCHCS